MITLKSIWLATPITLYLAISIRAAESPTKYALRKLIEHTNLLATLPLVPEALPILPETKKMVTANWVARIESFAYQSQEQRKPVSFEHENRWFHGNKKIYTLKGEINTRAHFSSTKPCIRDEISISFDTETIQNYRASLDDVAPPQGTKEDRSMQRKYDISRDGLIQDQHTRCQKYTRYAYSDIKRQMVPVVGEECTIRIPFTTFMRELHSLNVTKEKPSRMRLACAELMRNLRSFNFRSFNFTQEECSMRLTCAKCIRERLGALDVTQEKSTEPLTPVRQEESFLTQFIRGFRSL